MDRTICTTEKILLWVLWVVLAVSCSARRNSPESPPASPSASHALQDVRIREIMGRLALPLDRLPQETDPASQRQRLLADMASVAEELEANAKRIPEILTDVRMADEHRKEFLDYARQLAEQAEALGSNARRNDLAGARQVFRNIDKTCQHCHERFRVLPLGT